MDRVTLPEPGSFDGTGTVRGSVSFEAAGLILEEQPSGNPRVVGQVAEQTTMVFAEFEAPIDSWLTGRADYRIEGLTTDPIEVSAETAPAHATGSQIVSLHAGSQWTDDSTVMNVAALLRIAVEAPGVVVAPGRDYFEGTAISMDLRLGESGTLTDLGTLVGTTGSVTVEAFDPPTSGAFGVIRGTMETEARVEEGAAGFDGEEARVTGRFALPLTPVGAYGSSH